MGSRKRTALFRREGKRQGLLRNGAIALLAALPLPLAAQNTIYEYTVPSGSYSPTGNVLQYQENVVGTTGSWTLIYDPLNRLTNATSQSGPFQGTSLGQQYDSFGNRLGQGVTSSGANTANLPEPSWATYDSSGSQTCPYSGTNRLCTSDRAQGGLPTSAPDGMANGYDAAGNLLGDGVIRVRYDAEGRVCAVSSPSSPGVIQYVYDAEGTRVAKVSSNSFTCLGGSPDAASVSSRYIVGPSGEQVTELDGQNQWRHSSFYVGGAILATYDANGVHFPLKDADGSLRVQVNGAATIDETCVSLPFGDGQNCSGSDISEHHYTGKERDAESGLDYFGARYYSGSSGRFISPDPSNQGVDFFYPQTWNHYSYVLNAPLVRVDRNGLWPTAVHEGIIDKAFPGLTQTQRDYLKIASSQTDSDQSPEGSYKHGMANGNDPNGAVHAQQDSADFITKNEHDAEAIQAAYIASGHTGIAPAALTAFGNALHTITDETSPSHEGYQPWYGIGLGAWDEDVYHFLREFVPWFGNMERRQRAVDLAQRAFFLTFGDKLGSTATHGTSSARIVDWHPIQNHEED